MKFLTKARRNLEFIVFVLTCAAFLIVLMSALPKYLVRHPLSRPREPIVKMFFLLGNEVIVAALVSMISREG